MKLVVLAVSLFLLQIPRNDPNGIWEAETGSQFELRLKGADLHVQIVPGSNPRYLEYEVNLKQQEEVNTYKGNGYFLARLQNGKECKFDTEWHIVVVSPERILGAATMIIPDPETCAVRERSQLKLDLKKKK